MDEDKANVGDEEMDIRSNFQKVYGWFIIVNRVAANDIAKHELIYQKKLIEILNQLSYLLDYDREQKKLQNKQTKTI
jgi:hypothetical protein